MQTKFYRIANFCLLARPRAVDRIIIIGSEYSRVWFSDSSNLKTNCTCKANKLLIN